MNFPRKMLNSRKSPSFQKAQAVAEHEDYLRVKFGRVVHRHEQMKIAYQSLKSQIKSGLIEAEEVLVSLAIPLIKLVGLKTTEMAEEGRFSTIISDDTDSPSVENYATKATVVGREIIEKQQSQLIQLVHLLKQIETQVNCRHNDMLQALAKHRISLKEFFQKAIFGLSNLRRQNGDTFPITMKLLKALFDYMGSVFGSVETGVDDLMQDLAESLCNPMVDYVKGLKADMKMGACARLLTIVDEMDKTITSGRVELEEARKKIKFSEQGKIQALCKLKETEEKVKRMNEQLRLLPKTRNKHEESLFHSKSAISMKFQGVLKEGQDKDDMLLWELLKKKRKYQTPESPMGPGELLNFVPKTKHHKPPRQPLMAYSPVPQSCQQGGLLRVPLGSSPSAAIQQAFSSKCINR